MKRIVLLLLLLSARGFSQSGYTVSIVTDDIWWWSKESWGVRMHAVITHNDSVVPKNSKYWYTWRNTRTDTVFLSGAGKDTAQIDQNVDSTFGLSYRVEVTNTDTVNHTFTDIVSPISGTSAMVGHRPQLVMFRSYQANGSVMPSGIVLPYHWRWTMDKWIEGYSGWLTLNLSEALEAVPSYVPSMGQKLNHWNGIPSNILNYNTFYVDTTTKIITAQYGSVDSTATITTYIADEAGSNGGAISFQDPWLMDYADPEYGNEKRSEGMSAPFKLRQSPFHPDSRTSYNGDIYNGVFLNQEYNIPGNPYYSVSVPPIQIINGYTAFFAGWTSSPSGSATFKDSTDTTTAIVFNSPGATVIAQYKYYTVTYNTTVPSGTWPMKGSVTVPTGVTLAVSAGATLQFPINTGLTVSGVLSADSATFTSSSGTWNGITLNADNSSLINCTISCAFCPLRISNVGRATISGGIINNSTFSSTQAILVSNSTPSIVGLTINGQTGSWNGVRYTNGSGGILSNCVIRNLGAGNGIVIQGGSSPTIEENTVSRNYYHGIVITSNTGTPIIKNNVIDSSGYPNKPMAYDGIYFNNSANGIIMGNITEYNNFGIVCWRNSSPNAFSAVNDRGNNTIRNSNYGIWVTDCSYPNFGGGVASKGEYWGTCNNIYGNSLYDAYASGTSGITAEYNWWGKYPVNTGKIYSDNTSYVDISNALTMEGNCPGNVSPVAQRYISVNSGDQECVTVQIYKGPIDAFKQIEQLRVEGEYKGAETLCRNILGDTAAVGYYKRALLTLFSIAETTKDSTVVDELLGFSKSGDKDLIILASGLLALMYEGEGKVLEAERTLNELKVKYSGSEIEKWALIDQASLKEYDNRYERASTSALNELVEKYSSGVDPGLLAALGARRADLHPETISEGDESITNYPNPFNPSTIISYNLRKGGHVTLKVYDILGREVVTLVDESQGVGSHRVIFDSRYLSSGIYFYVLSAPGIVEVRKMALIR